MPKIMYNDIPYSGSPSLSNKVSKTGDTMTGDLIAPSFIAMTNASPCVLSKVSDVDASKANNNVSSTRYPAYYVSDSSNRILTRLESVIESDGDIGSYWYVRNYDTSGTQVGQKGIKMSMDKTGGLSYTVDEAAKFRSALELATVASSGSYNDLSNKPTIPDISGKVNKSGDTMSGALTMNNVNVNIKDTDIKVGTAPSSTIWGNGLYCQSNNAGDLWYIRSVQDTSDNVGLQLEVQRTVSGTRYYSFLRMGISNNGNRTVSVSEPAAWRSAIGHPFEWDINTNNTTDTWVPVMTGSKMQHRVLHASLNSPQTVSFTRSHASVSYQEGLVCYRFGNVIMFAGYFSSGATIAANTTLYSGLPKPAGGKHIYFTWSGYDFYLHGSDGSIRTNQQITSRTYIGTFTYVCA